MRQASLVSNSGGSLPRLKKIQTVAEVLEPSARHRIEAAFGVPVCGGNGFHIHSENVILVLSETVLVLEFSVGSSTSTKCSQTAHFDLPK